MKFLLAVVLLATAKGSKDANSSNLNMVLVKALQGQLKTCMDQNRDLVQRSCQKPGHWGGRGDIPMKRRAYAFHAELGTTVKDLPHNQKLVFAKIHLNEGGAYDPQTGIFTCKEPGIYVFDWTILTENKLYFYSELKVDGITHGRLSLETTNTANTRSGSNMVVAKLKQGSQVWIEPYDKYVGKLAYGKWSFFSGFKI